MPSWTQSTPLSVGTAWTTIPKVLLPITLLISISPNSCFKAGCEDCTWGLVGVHCWAGDAEGTGPTNGAVGGIGARVAPDMLSPRCTASASHSGSTPNPQTLAQATLLAMWLVEKNEVLAFIGNSGHLWGPFPPQTP